jgi:exopolysaccharide biosynthesis polyprenyl glycosylphosphotransferase
MAQKRRVKFIRFIYVLLDIFLTCLAIYLACVMRRRTLPFPITVHNLFFDYGNPFQFVFHCWILSIVFFNNLNGLYQTRREILESIEIWQVLKSVFYAAVVTMVAIYLLKVEGFPRSILILSGLFIYLFLSIWRMLKRLFVEYLVTRGYNNFNVLIIGGGKVGVALVNEIRKRPGLGLRICGFLDDFKTDKERITGIPILGKIADFSSIARREFVNKVFITIHHDSQAFLQLLEQARELRIAVRVIPQGFEFSTGEFFKYNIGFVPVLEYCDEEHRVKQAGKRLFDFLVAMISLALLWPVFILVGIIIKLDSRGPIFYRSQRYGCRGKVFMMYKFRSMINNAEETLQTLRTKNEVDGPIFKIKEDPRVTRLGRLLRKYSLDELPQLFNVLKGDMSLVGPRPLPIDQIEKEDLRQLKRLDVRPGITGLWQIRGRSDISFARLVKWDVWYINNWSFWLDVNILFQTIPIVLKGRGAY